jgi:hypothetical protein
MVPTVMARAKGRKATAVRTAESPSTVCMKIEARNTPTRIPVTPSITAVPDTSASSSQT